MVDISYDLNELSADGDQIQQPVGSKLGAPMKEWEDLGPHQKRKETQKIFDEIKKTAQARKVEPVRLVGTMLRR